MAVMLTAIARLRQDCAGRRTPPRCILGLLMVSVLGLGVVGGVAYYRFCNVPRSGPDWSEARLNSAIVRGLDYLVRTEAFEKAGAGGEHHMHHFLLDLVLAKQPHLTLREQQARCDAVSESLRDWRSFYGLPGRPERAYVPVDRSEVQAQIRDDPRPYGRWLLWAVHARWARLNPEDAAVLLEAPDRLTSSYDLTHALMAYWLMQRTAPEVAQRWSADARIREMLERVKRFTRWAPRCSDGYLERVAFTILMQPSEVVSRRWIERMLTVQNLDGGWTMDPPYTRTLQELFGLGLTDLRSEPHATVLALLALTHYRERVSLAGMFSAR